jgi:hypothetical protein
LIAGSFKEDFRASAAVSNPRQLAPMLLAGGVSTIGGTAL